MNKPASALALSEGQRQTLQTLSRSTASAHRLVVRSRALLLAGDGVANARIAAECGVAVTIRNVAGYSPGRRSVNARYANVRASNASGPARPTVDADSSAASSRPAAAVACVCSARPNDWRFTAGDPVDVLDWPRRRLGSAHDARCPILPALGARRAAAGIQAASGCAQRGVGDHDGRRLLDQSRYDGGSPAPGQPARGVIVPVSYTHLRAHETPEHLVCRLLLE